MIFQFNLEGEHLNSYPYARKIGFIEGTLQIYIDGQLFYEDIYANVYELAQQLAKWLLKLENREVVDFFYNCIDSEEQLLQFHVQGERVRVYAPYEERSVKPLPIETVKAAVLKYCIDLHIALTRIGYKYRLTDELKQLVSDNQWALILFECNVYDEAFSQIEQLAKSKPSVESLNNYAYLLLHEEEDHERAWDVLQQLLPMQPQSDFPYLMLGELALRFKRYQEAKTYLQQALHFGTSEPAMHNIGIAHFHLGEYEQAAQAFSQCAGDSGMVQLYEVVSWLRAGQMEKAKSLLDHFNEQADDFIGASEIADVYMELGYFSEAHALFAKEWNDHYTMPYSVSRYAYTLWQLGEYDACQQMLQQAILTKQEEIADEKLSEIDEHWSEQDCAEHIEELQQELVELQALTGRLAKGFIPPFEFELYPTGGCQLFGCPLHGHPEYEELLK